MQEITLKVQAFQLLVIVFLQSNSYSLMDQWYLSQIFLLTKNLKP